MNAGALQRDAVAEVVASPGRVMVEAKGNVRAVAIAYVMQTAPCTRSTSGVGAEPLDRNSAKLLTGQFMNFRHERLHAVRGKVRIVKFAPHAPFTAHGGPRWAG